MSAIATAIVGSAIIGGVSARSAGKAQERAAETAAQASRETTQSSIEAQERMFNRQVELQEPFRETGLAAQNRLADLLGISGRTSEPGYGYGLQRFTMDNYREDPGYGFRLKRGLDAMERTAAARGGLLSGNQLRGAMEFGQDLASQEYQNAFNRFQTERAARLNPLQSLMGSGQSAANVMTGAAGQMGQNQASNIYNAGQARASGYIGQANALNTALGQIGGMVGQIPMQNAMMDYYRGNTFDSSRAKGPGFGSATRFNLTGQN